MDDEGKKALIRDSIRGIPNFPKPGILFWDVTTLMLNPSAFRFCIDMFSQRYKDLKVDVVAGFEARGLIFGAPLAIALNCAFVPLRKPGKLPGEVLSQEYITEYSRDKICMHVGAVQPGQRVVLVDDLIATGGTMAAGINLVRGAGGEVVEAACVIELPDLKGKAKLGGVPLYILVEKEGL